MKTKLLALLFLVGSAAFAAPRVVVGVGVGPVGVGVGVAPAYGYYAPPAPAAAYVAPAPSIGDLVRIMGRVGWRHATTGLVTTDVVTTVAVDVRKRSGDNYAGLRPSKAS